MSKKAQKAIVWTIGIVIGFIAICAYFSKLDSARDVAYAAYEDCVYAEYGVYPPTFYQLTGTMPYCDY